MLNFKKKLSIDIEELREDEEDIQNLQINKEISNLKMGESPICYDGSYKFSEDDRNRILELNNPIINQILAYYESENNFNDFSFSWYGNDII